MSRDYTNSFILQALNIPIITDLESLSNETALSKKLLYVLSNKPDKYYKSFTILKRSKSSSRKILSPSYSLKLVQRWILKEILYKVAVSEESMAFVPGKGNGIKRNAQCHMYSLYILGLDMENFFPSIPREKVFFIFRNLGYNNMVSNILANLCTYKGYLPQGGVTSPYISNLVCNKLDKRIKGLCNKIDVLYTRYADDMTFSCDNKQVLKKIKNIAIEIIEDEGYRINHSKTRLLSPSSHKIVNGITINENKLKASNKLKRDVRSMIHRSIATKDYSKINIIRGYISYINSIEEGYKGKIIEYVARIMAKDYKNKKDVVLEFNKNKLYKKILDMKYIKAIYPYPLRMKYEEKLEDRKNYLSRLGLLTKEEEEIIKVLKDEIYEEDD